MLPLIKIRITYLKRNKRVLFCNYLFLPVLIFIIIIVILIKSGTPDLEINDKQEYDQIYEISNIFSSLKSDCNENNFLAHSSIISEDSKLRNKLIEFINEECNLDIKGYSDEKSINTTQNLIILDYEKKDKFYKFTFKQIQSDDYNDYQKHEIESIFPFYENISTQISADPFIYNTEIEKNNFKNYDNIEKQNNFYLLLQTLLAKFLIKNEKNKDDISIDINFKFGFNSFPKSVKNFEDYTTVQQLVGMIASLQYTGIFICFAIQMLQEKDLKLEKLLERQGVFKVKYAMSWFINFLIVTLPTNLDFFFGGLLVFGNYRILLIIDIILWIFAQFALIYFIVTVSPNKKGGIIIAVIVSAGSMMTGSILTQRRTKKYVQIIFNIFPNISIFSSLIMLSKLQSLSDYSLEYLRIKYNEITYLDTIIMLIFDVILYCFLALFFKSYKNSGLPFLKFLKSIFKKVNRNIILPGNAPINNDDLEIEQNHEELNKVNQSLMEQNSYLSIKNVSRIYGDVKAVDNFSGSLFKNEIFCLLGHNGAGKTTLIKMISGLEDPDNGDIFLDNISIVTDKNYLYHNIGLCEQEDIFFDYLTVSEHLKYMMEIKGSEKDKEQINTFINKIDLESKKDSLCKSLSGGEKRKLCIAMALIGDSKLVLLDEPTSGMDVMAKRALWDSLKEFKNEKIIILTTHSLDEAEYLGDRIGIMSNGHFICSGTSSYLKSKYPCGFNLNLLVDTENFNDNYKNELIQQLVKYEPNLEVKISSKGLFSLNIQSNNKNIKEIFNAIESNKKKYFIEDYTVSSTSLEDVFLKLNHKITIGEDKDENNGEENNNNENELLNVKEPIMNNYDFNLSASFVSQLLSHIKRGFFSLWRNKIYSFLELLIGLFIIYIYVFMYSDTIEELSKNELSLTTLLKSNDIYICKDNKDFLKNSYVNKHYSSIKLKTIDNIYEEKKFIEKIYNKALGNIAKSGICIKKPKEGDNKNYTILATEIPIEYPSYIMANIMFSMSAYLKKEYGINAAIITDIEVVKKSYMTDIGISLNEILVAFYLGFIFSFSASLYLGSIISEKIKERVKNIKHILYLSGANLWSYWGGFLVVDAIKMTIFFSIGSIGLYYYNGSASYIWLNSLISIFSILLFGYCFSFLLPKEDSGQKSMMLLIGIAFILFLVILIIILQTGADINKILKYFLNRYSYTVADLIPLLSFIVFYIKISISYLLFKTFTNNDSKFEFDGFDIYKNKYYELSSFIVNIINCVIYTCILILLESGILGRFSNYIKVKYFIKDTNITFSNEQMSEEFMNNNIINNQNSDANAPLLENNNNNINENTNKTIQNEINKVNNDTENKLTMKIIGLKKTYCLCCKKNIRAINNLYLGLNNNEKFGLLGFNGSGKTTTFKSITKEILFDSGSIILFGNNNKTEFNKIRKSIGYCPQENPIFDYMKVREIIKFYLEIKGANESVETICERFGLSKFLDTYCINLSGGNKRKLSFAIALMCKPRLLLLDEPSTGVDPESRRIMWKNILDLTKKNVSFNMILTTHSMEEAEVLCDTVSWLKSGNFISIGNPEKLKIMYSAGYKLHIKFIQLSQEHNLNIDDDEVYEKLPTIIRGFDENIKDNKDFLPYLKELLNVVDSIKDKCSKIDLKSINKDFSFEFNIDVIKENQSELFTQILDMKNTNELISEISISMESLENILTRL